MTLRGGGAFCSQYNIVNITVRHTSDDDMLQNFIRDVGQKCEEIQAASNKIGLQESKDLLIEKIKWFIYASQFVNQLNRNQQMIKENIQLILDNLKILLQILSSIAVKYLQSIFQINFYILCQQSIIQNELGGIGFNIITTQRYKKLGQQDQQNSYQNSIYYQQTLISMCIDTCPTDSQQGQEVLMSTFSGILSSITDMTPTTDLLQALGNGALFLAQEYRKKQQLQIFQIIFYLEELKWQVIEELQNGIGINKLLAIMSQNYKQLVLKSNLWIIKCSWIKIISELFIYKPLITKSKYQKLTSQYQLTESWEDAIQLQLISIIDSNRNIGIIQNRESNRIGRILNIQLNKFEQFKLLIINGHHDIPKLQDLINQSQQDLHNKDMNKIIKFQQLLDQLPLIQISQQCQQFIQNLQDYSDAIQEIIEEANPNTIIIFDQIEQLIMLNQQLLIQSNDLQLHGQILILQLDTISQTSQQQIKNDCTTDKYLLFYLFQQFFEACQNNQAIGNVDEQLSLFVNKLKARDFKVVANNDLEQMLKQQQEQSIKQTINFTNQQQQKQNSEMNMSALQKLQIFLKLMKEFQQAYESEIRNSLIDHKIILQNFKWTRNMNQLQKLSSITFDQLFYYTFQMNMLNNIDTLINDLKFDESNMTELQQNKLSDLISIDFQSYQYDIEDLIHQKNSIFDQLQNISQFQDKQENLEFQSQTLKHLRQLLIRYQKWMQEFIKHIDNYQSILKETFQSNLLQEPKIISQLKQNFQQLASLSNSQYNQQDMNSNNQLKNRYILELLIRNPRLRSQNISLE
ncbi:hypothetical protein pb186bvf_010466 [Paramecium bursaria]